MTPGTRHVQQIVFKDKAEADTAAAALAAGTTFADLVAQRNLKPADIDLGQITRDKIVDPAVAEAAFAMSADGNSGVVEGRFGPVILHVDTIQPEVVKSFDEVKDQLKKEIATEQAAADITAMHDSIEDARAGGDDLATVAGKYGMKLVTVPAVDASGKDPDGKQIPDLPAGLVAAAFGTDVNIANDPIEPTRNTYIWYEVTALTAAHDRPLAEVRDKVVAAWKDAERDKKVTAQADDLKAKLAGGADIATVAADASLDVRTVDKVTRGMQPTGELSADAVKAAFEGPKGYVAITAGALPLTRIVLVVDDSTVPAYDPKDPQLVSIKKSLDTQYQNDLLAAYITDRQSKTEVRLNQAAMSAALGISQN